MKVLVIGSQGFIARNLIVTLENIIAGKDKSYPLPEPLSLCKYSRDMGGETLKESCKSCDFVFYLAGTNRPENAEEYWNGNVGLLEIVLNELRNQNNPCPVMYASSVQADLDNEYGKSKRAGEKLLVNYSRETGKMVYIYRLPNVFGKWSKPNYNSVIATFCYNIARDLPIQINDPEKRLSLVYIDDVVQELVGLLWSAQCEEGNPFRLIRQVYEVSLQEIVDLLQEFKNSRICGRIPSMEAGSFSQRLYSTYLTFLPEEAMKYSCVMNQDKRGSFTELFQTKERGQFSVNITKPGITKGEHWHHTKNEKFIVVSGTGLIQLRKIESNRILNFYVSGEEIEIIDIPAGYTHNIINIGKDNLVTIIWASENFHSEKPDTFFLKVEENEEC